MLQASPFYAYLPAVDVARARAFYEGKLGLTPGRELAGGVVYDFGGGTRAFLYPTPNAGTNRASQAFWSVKDVVAEVRELRARGVTFERYDGLPGEKSEDGIVVGAAGARAAWFTDTEGNILALIEALP